MALIKSCRNNTPQIAEGVWLADNATVVGEVSIGSGSSVWFSSVIRGDVNSIDIGKNVNIQDGAVIHCTYEKTKVKIADNVSIGHNALVHGCNIDENVLIGMGAIVMDNVHVHSNVIVAAGAVVLENSILESNGIYAGVPAKRVKELSPELFENEIKRISRNYKTYASWFQK